MAEWRLLAGPWRGGRRRHLTRARDIACTWRLAPSHELSFTIIGRHPEAALVIPLQTDVHLLRDGTPLYTGRVGAPGDNATADNHERTIATADYRALLGRRTWRNAQTTWDYDQLTTVRFLLQAAQNVPGGDLGIGSGVLTETGVKTTRVTEAGARILDEIQALATAGAAEDSRTPGFDWDLTPGWDGRDLQLWAPTRGTRRAALRYRWQDDPDRRESSIVATATRGFDPGSYANAVTVTGGVRKVATTTVDPSTGQTVVTVNEVPTQPVYRAVADLGSRPEGLWDQTISYPDITDQGELVAKADARLAALQAVTPTWTVTLRSGSWRGPDHYWIGDTVPLRITSGVVTDDLDLRITELHLQLDTSGKETVTLTLGPPLGGVGATLASQNQRLAALELRP